MKTEKSKDSTQEHSASDINQLACCLKNAIFSKYISHYLIEKVEEVNTRKDFFFDFSHQRCGIYMSNVLINIFKKSILILLVNIVIHK